MFSKDELKKFFFIVLCLVAFKLIENYSYFFGQFNKFVGIVMPFVWGLAFAYILNPLMMFIEKKHKGINRILSVVIVYIIFASIVAIILIFVIPVISENIMDLYNKSSLYFSQLEKYYNSVPFKDIVVRYNLLEVVKTHLQDILRSIVDLSNLTVTSILGATISLAYGLLNFILGAFVSIYFLYDKEKLLSYMKKVIIALSGDKKSRAILAYFSKVNMYFYSFLVGKFIDSTIIGVLCFIGLTALKIRYAVLLSIIVGVLNMIPYFGPFMGAVPAVLITLLYSPIQALWVIIFILILQQFDGWYLGPTILGNTVGASPLFIIFSILVGGGFFGPVGMLLAVPFLKSLVTLWDAFLENKEKVEKVEQDEL